MCLCDALPSGKSEKSSCPRQPDRFFSFFFLSSEIKSVLVCFCFQTPNKFMQINTLKSTQNAISIGIAFLSYLSIVKRFIEEDRLPHLLFYGPPGTGKTSTILAVAKQIYSAREFNSMVLEVGDILKRNVPQAG